MHPRYLLKPAVDLLGAVTELRELLDEPPPERGDGILWRFGRRAMATTFEVLLPAGTPLAQDFAVAALDEIDRLESVLTAYRAESELSRVNRTAALKPVEVEENLFQLLAQCQWLWRETGGGFDIALGALIKCWGFFERQPHVPEPRDLIEARRRSGMAQVALDAANQTVRFHTPGVEINLGSVGKGYALDCVGDLFRREARLTDLLLQGGHSSILALGSQPGSTRGWTIGLADPQNPAQRLGLLRVRNRGVGTSAATYLHLQHQGRTLGHILDPRTGWPAEGMLSATVTAPNAMLADALATAFFILGVDAAREFCQAHPAFGCVLLAKETYPRPVLLGRAVEEYRPLA
ncbi:MAG: FAD:protein FMN transferase [Gemmataceae bacterium]